MRASSALRVVGESIRRRCVASAVLSVYALMPGVALNRIALCCRSCFCVQLEPRQRPS
jgi:hypothetical protein